MEITYTLTCDGCKDAYYSKEGFPKPQYCPKCLVVYKAGRKSILDEAFNKMEIIEHRQITIKKKLSDVELVIQQARQEVVEFLVKDGEQGLLANLNKLTKKYAIQLHK